MKILDGGSLQSKSFKEVFKQWEIDLPKLIAGKGRADDYAEERTTTVGRYPLDFFKDKKIDDIQKKDFIEYRIWRNESSIKVNPSTNKSVPYIPSNNTLRKEATFIKQMFEYAVDKGWCSSIPNMDVPPLDKNRRPTFTPIEWRKLTRLFREWVKEGENWVTLVGTDFLFTNMSFSLPTVVQELGSSDSFDGMIWKQRHWMMAPNDWLRMSLVREAPVRWSLMRVPKNTSNASTI